MLGGGDRGSGEQQWAVDSKLQIVNVKLQIEIDMIGCSIKKHKKHVNGRFYLKGTLIYTNRH